ncbi:MAG: 50S ribosomal protein L4 [Patescibacteria group bacterium]|jgi:large subunit ribosomal protein L4|nr:50S ribosomal protein L4 [Patescibacteria group bacterium]
MSKFPVYNFKGEKVKEVDLNPAIFGLKIKPELVQQAVVIQQANSRQVIAHAKDRSEVSGGGRKPWRQKGTGRARHGSSRSPIWRGGGITFGPTKDRNFSVKMNQKAKQKALLMTLSDKAHNQKIVLIDELSLTEAKTKKFLEILQNLNLRPTKKSVKKDKTETGEKKQLTKKNNAGVLVVLPKKDEALVRSIRNLEKVDSIMANSLNVIDVLKKQYLLLPLASITEIEKTFVK